MKIKMIERVIEMRIRLRPCLDAGKTAANERLTFSDLLIKLME